MPACSGRTEVGLPGFLAQLAVGTFLTDVSCSSLSSGVWLASVSLWGRNQRAFPEAGAAGHPGLTALGPVGPEPRVQRGSATTLSKSRQWYALLSQVLGDCSWLMWRQWPQASWGKLSGLPKTKGTRRFIEGKKKSDSVLFCFILAWRWILTRTLMSKPIPSVG